MIVTGLTGLGVGFVIGFLISAGISKRHVEISMGGVTFRGNSVSEVNALMKSATSTAEMLAKINPANRTVH